MANSTHIYLITNIDDNPYKAYVGKTKDFATRSYVHKRRFGNRIIIAIIDEVNSVQRSDWKILECYWIEQLGQWGYELVNKNKGGGGTEYHSLTTKKKLSTARSGKKRNPYKKRKDTGVSKGPFTKQACRYCNKLVGKNTIKMHQLQCQDNPDRVFLPNTKNSIRYKGISRAPYKEGIKKPKVSIALKGRKKPTVKCPHCNKEGGSNMKRYHFDNCKQK